MNFLVVSQFQKIALRASLPVDVPHRMHYVLERVATIHIAKRPNYVWTILSFSFFALSLFTSVWNAHLVDFNKCMRHTHTTDHAMHEAQAARLGQDQQDTVHSKISKKVFCTETTSSLCVTWSLPALTSKHFKWIACEVNTHKFRSHYKITGMYDAFNVQNFAVVFFSIATAQASITWYVHQNP